MSTTAIVSLLTLLDVSASCRVSPHTVRSWVRKGTLTPTRICRRLLFHPDELKRFQEQSFSVQKKAADSQSAAQREVRRANATNPG
jgi:DNA-binding transcriptional MerR regulator